ncbi:MAG: YbhB/YbcL family Raf kinase inhibitor-like protein [Cytophagales bacterium]|nr:YbhB/YbcL family Raf kinase inhibitor-like protein [Cytophaga sp.]
MKYILPVVLLSLVAFSFKTYPILVVTSPVFTDSSFIPAKYTCDGEGINPPLVIDSLPDETVSIVVIVEDPDVIVTYDHWVVFNIKPGKMEDYRKTIAENSKPGQEGQNGSGDIGYKGSCPRKGIHHYHYKVYALNSMLDLNEGTTKALVEAGMRGHILAYGELIGLYKRK